MKNMFEGAKYGDKFKTRDGSLAIYKYNYHRYDIEWVVLHVRFFSKDQEEFFIDITVDALNGVRPYQEQNKDRFDIVSRWEERSVQEGIIMDGQVYELVEKKDWNPCHECDLYSRCERSLEDGICAVFEEYADKRFKKINKTI